MKELASLVEAELYHLLQSTHGPLGRIWALVGTDQTLGEPAYDFQKGPLFVVEASSPRPARHSPSRKFSKCGSTYPW